MGNLKKHILRFWTDERGQSTTEYILILAVVVMIALKFKASFMSNMTKMTDQLDQKMGNALSDGAQ